MTKSGSRSFYSLNGIEWHSFAKAHLMTSRQIHYYMPFSTRRVRMSFCAIQGASPNVIYCHKKNNSQWLMAKSHKNLQFLPHNFAFCILNSEFIYIFVP